MGGQSNFRPLPRVSSSASRLSLPVAGGTSEQAVVPPRLHSACLGFGPAFLALVPGKEPVSCLTVPVSGVLQARLRKENRERRESNRKD